MNRENELRGAERVSVAAVHAYVRSCFARRAVPRVSELAETLGVSRGTLIKQVKNLKGTTPGAYFKAAQLTRAKRFLLRGWSIERAARAAGYATKRTFYRSFHEATGTTPAAFRRSERNVI
jgi:AraC-like DNA-binding protein